MASIPYPIFIHQTVEKLLIVKVEHNKEKKDVELIDAAKYLYREFIRGVMLYRLPVEDMSEQEYNKLVCEAYQRSDFDWTDKEEYIAYREWYIKD
jgi:hypothetical protein